MKDNKIIFLSIVVIVLSVATALYTSNISDKTYDVAIFIEGENANLARVADLLIEYDKNNYELVSTMSGGFFDNSSVIKKDNWAVNRSLLMSTSADQTKPVLKLRFKSKKDKPVEIKLSKSSLLYLANIGPASFPSNGVVYRVRYEQ